MKLYIYDSNMFFLEEVEEVEGITYHNSTPIKPDFGDKDPSIYQAKWDKFSNSWIIEYKPDFVAQKAKELGLEIVTVSTMSEEDLRSGKLPVLDTIQQQYLELKSEELD